MVYEYIFMQDSVCIIRAFPVVSHFCVASFFLGKSTIWDILNQDVIAETLT